MEVREPPTGFADVNGAKLYYKIAGKGRPLVLLHAGIADSRMWDVQLNVFAQHYQVIAYDIRGFGKTEMPAGPFTHYQDLHGLLKHLKVDSAYVLGASMGGGVAIDFTLEYPEMVDSLILVASALEGYEFTDPVTIKQWEEVDALLEQGNYVQAADLEIKMWVAGPQRTLAQVDPAVRELFREMLIPTYAIPPDRGTEQPLEPSAISRLTEIRVPTLVVVGDCDVPDVLKIADILAAGIAGAKRVVVPGVAHLPNIEKPEEFNQIVLDFLGRLPTSGTQENESGE